MTVAVGNDGAHGQNRGRIQPPADAVNAFAVGASGGSHEKAGRASYSCLGPGRSPGVVKPDAIAFGEAKGSPLRLHAGQFGRILTCKASPIQNIGTYDVGCRTAQRLLLTPEVRSHGTGLGAFKVAT